MSTNIAVLGAQWGDEGKGKIVDMLTPHFSTVARYQGGHNAGHTVYVRRPEVRPAPDSVRHPASRRHLRHRQRRRHRSAGALPRSGRAGAARHRGRRPAARQREGARHPAVSPRARRAVRGAARRAQDRHDVARHRPGLRGQDRSPRHPGVRSARRSRGAGRRKSARTSMRAIRSSRSPRSTGSRCSTSCSRHGERMRPWVGDVSLLLATADGARADGRAVRRARRRRCSTSITAPIPSSPRPTRRSAASAPGLGVPPRAIGGVLGVAKAYTTRVGEGPLPTELSGALAERLRESGQEYGASTGRPRRCGWYDAVVVRYSARINGLDAIALTKLDVLDGLPEVHICTGYRTRTGRAHRVPGRPARARPAPSRSTRRCRGGRRRRAASHDSTRCRPKRSATSSELEEVSGVPCAIVSTGSDRTETIVREDTIVQGLAVEADGSDGASVALLRLAELLDGHRIGVEEFEAGAVLRTSRRQLERRPDHAGVDPNAAGARRP